MKIDPYSCKKPQIFFSKKSKKKKESKTLAPPTRDKVRRQWMMSLVNDDVTGKQVSELPSFET